MYLKNIFCLLMLVRNFIYLTIAGPSKLVINKNEIKIKCAVYTVKIFVIVLT